MSVNRENAVWKSRDGTWNIGFFDFYQSGPDFEWDVEYNFDAFNWCSTGHSSEQAARDAWDGANPGGGEVYEECGTETDRFDGLAMKYNSEKRHESPFG